MALRALVSTLLVALLGLAPSGTAAKLATKPAAKVWPGHSGLALDAGGVPHLAFQSPKRQPFHAERVGKKFERELVDGAPDAGFDSAIAVDPQDGVHLAYRVEETAPSPAQTLVYAFANGGAWQLEAVDAGGYATSLALDADDRVHLLHADASGNLAYAIQEDVGFDLHATELVASPLRPTSLAIDADGNAHASYVRNTGSAVAAYYATNASGAWQETQLDPNGHFAALALDAGGHPSVAVLTPAAVLLFHHDGVAWTSETAFDLGLQFPFFRFGPDGITLALAPSGRFVLATFSATLAVKSAEVLLFLAHDGEEWRAARLGSKDEGFDPVLAAAADGALHGIWRAGDAHSPTLFHLTASFPDLKGAWDGVATAPGSVTGTLRVGNEGNDRAPGAPIELYLSGDAVLDPGDTRLRPKLALGALAPGEEQTLAVESEVAGPVTGLYLIAVIDPDKRTDDLDRGDNHVAVLIP